MQCVWVRQGFPDWNVQIKAAEHGPGGVISKTTTHLMGCASWATLEGKKGTLLIIMQSWGREAVNQFGLGEQGCVASIGSGYLSWLFGVNKISLAYSCDGT